MTDRALMQQALEALEAMNPYPATKADQRASAIEALRARLAEPVQEPVAFRWKVKINDVDGWVVGHNEPPPYAIEQQPLYTAPPQRRSEPEPEPVKKKVVRKKV